MFHTGLNQPESNIIYELCLGCVTSTMVGLTLAGLLVGRSLLQAMIMMLQLMSMV